MPLTEEQVKLDEELKTLEARKLSLGHLSTEEEARLVELKKTPKSEEPKEKVEEPKVEAPKHEEKKEEAKPAQPEFTAGMKSTNPFGRGSR